MPGGEHHSTTSDAGDGQVLGEESYTGDVRLLPPWDYLVPFSKKSSYHGRATDAGRSTGVPLVSTPLPSYH
jgi:hypothetical protein